MGKMNCSDRSPTVNDDLVVSGQQNNGANYNPISHYDDDLLNNSNIFENDSTHHGSMHTLTSLTSDRVGDDDYFYLNDNFLSKEFREKSCEVACDIVTYVCRAGFLDPLPPPSKTAQIMRHLVDDLLKNRRGFMRSMTMKIVNNINQPENLSPLLNELATQMFDDGVVTWNRIVTFHAFCGYVARLCQIEAGLMHADEIVAEILSSIVINRLGLWMVTCGGWGSFDRQFPAVCVFSLGSLWKFFLFFMILATAVFMFYKFISQLDRSQQML